MARETRREGDTHTPRRKHTHTEEETHTLVRPLEAPHQGPALFKQHPPAQPPAMKGIKQGVCVCVCVCVCTSSELGKKGHWN